MLTRVATRCLKINGLRKKCKAKVRFGLRIHKRSFSYKVDRSGVFYGTSTVEVKEGQIEAFKDILSKHNLIGKAREWDGNIFYYCTQDNENKNIFHWFEKWESNEKALKWIQGYAGKIFYLPEMDNILVGSDVKNGKIGLTIGGTSVELLDNVQNNIEKTDTNTEKNQDWLHYTPSWVGGRCGAVGQRVNEVKSLSNNTGLSYRLAYDVNLPIDAMWSAFDDYFDIQCKNPLHHNGKHVDGPVNAVGEILAFDGDAEKYSGLSQYYEKLIVKDDNNYVWKLDINPLNNHTIFEKYYYTVRLYNDYINKDNTYDTDRNFANNGCLMVTDLEWQFKDNIPISVRDEFCQFGKENGAFYCKFMYDYAFDKVGTHFYYGSEVDVPVKWLYEYVSNWTILGFIEPIAKEGGLDMVQPLDVRIFETKNGDKILERVSDKTIIKENEKYRFEYQILNGITPLRDTLIFEKIDENRSKISAKLSIFPNDQNREILVKTYQNVANTAESLWPKLFTEAYAKSQK